MNPLSEQCPAMSKRSRRRCQRMVVGGGVCSMHGGRAPQVAAKREARIVTAAAQLAGEPWDERDPGEALMAAASDADALVQRLKRQLVTAEQVDHASLTALGEWIDRVGRLSKVVLDARIDERRMRVSERQGTQIAGVIKAILSDLNLTPEQWALVPMVVPMRLREVSAQEPIRAIGAGETT